MRFSTLSLLLPALAHGWITTSPLGTPRAANPTRLHMALDYNDPVVGEEFNNVQPMSYEEVEEELLTSGIRAPPTMNEMEVRLMLVEMRLRKAGKMPGASEKKKPTKFNNKFEEMMYTKPAFEELYNKFKDKGDHNALNVMKEYISDEKTAESRYGKDYKGLLRQLKSALTAPPPVKTPTIKFSGFPANMGEAACKMTLEAVGPISEFECEESEDFPVLIGKVTFEDIESAKKAVEQYNGMDMGMGSALELESV